MRRMSGPEGAFMIHIGEIAGLITLRFGLLFFSLFGLPG